MPRRTLMVQPPLRMGLLMDGGQCSTRGDLSPAENSERGNMLCSRVRVTSCRIVNQWRSFHWF